MWQRIQTLYLAISTVLTGMLFFVEKAEGISFIAYIPYLILLIIIGLLHIIALMAWTHRVFQARTAVLSAIFCLALQVWLVVDFCVTGNDPLFRISALFPLVSLVLDVLAAANIWSDELMVRSSSRLRAAKRKGIRR